MSSFDGNSIKIQFNATINGSYQGSPGLYNGDPTSQDYNPLGWYSYKAVVKQTEQDYYNAYIPTAMAAYPLNDTKELGATSHVVLYSDNVNKIPRDLKEVGPTDKEYRSSVRLFGRVTNFLSVSDPANLDTNQQFYSESLADISNTIATIKDFFDYEAFADISLSANEYIFYNFDYDANAGGAFPDASAFVARINTQKQFGAQVPQTGGTAGRYINGPFLNVYEVEPTVSLLDIYYETTTSGVIDDLNQAINAGGGADSFHQINDWNWYLTEGNNGTTDPNPVDSFRPVKFDGTSFAPAADTTGEILSIVDGAGNDANPENPGVLYYDAATPANGIFNIVNNNNGTFNIILNSPNGNVGLVYNEVNELVDPSIDPNQYTFEMKFNHPNAEETVLFKSGPLTNVLPEHKNCNPVVNVPPNLPIGGTMNPPPYLYLGVNGSSTTSLNQLGLSFEISQVINVATGSDVTDQNLFVLQNATNQFGQIEGRLTYAQQVQIPSSYDVTVKAYDFEGVEPAALGTCTTRYNFQQGVSGIIFGDSGGSVTSNSGDINATTLPGQVTVLGAAQNLSVQVELNTISITTNNAGSTTNLRIYEDPEGGNTGPYTDLPIFTPPTINLPPSPVTQTPIYPPGSPINRDAGTYYFELTIDANSVLPSQEFTATATIVSIP